MFLDIYCVGLRLLAKCGDPGGGIDLSVGSVLTLTNILWRFDGRSQ